LAPALKRRPSPSPSRPNCQAELPGRTARPNCQAELPGRTARPNCQAELVVAADQFADPALGQAGDVGHQLGGKAARQQPEDVKVAALDDGGGGLVQALQLSRRGVRNKMQGL
jgi:hypothetical protein